MKTPLPSSTISLLAILLLFAGLAHGQTFEEFKKQRESEFEQYKEEYNAFISRMSRQYDEYVQQRDKEFTEYLNQRWNEYKVFAGLRYEAKPKPTLAPEFDLRESIPAPKLLPVLKPDTPPLPRLQSAPRLPEIRKSEPEKFPTYTARFEFFGNRIALNYDPTLIVNVPDNINNLGISRFWNTAGKSNYNHLLNQMDEYRRGMNLNDWGYYLLVKHTAEQLYPNSENGVNLMAWFLMNRSGYKARAAYHNDQVLLMLPANQVIYHMNFHTYDGVNYYIVAGNATSINTYDKDFPGASRILDLSISSPLSLGDNLATTTVDFSFEGKTHKLSFNYCLNTVSFFENYPLAHLDVYFNATVSRTAKESLLETLMPLVAGKNETDAVNLLLNFAQTAFEYKTDQEQFGYENFFFAEEMLHYPYSDCEDRSVFFAWLVRELLHLKVIGVEYEDHVATAVSFNQDVAGSYFLHSGEKYIICDPTYINARVGIAMPQYADASAQLHEVSNNQYYGNLANRIWENIFAYGGRRAGNRLDLVFDKEGNAFATGYFSGNATFGNTRLRAAENTQAVFIAMFNMDAEVVWVSQPESIDHATAYQIALDEDENIFISGTFRNRITIGNTTLTTSNQSDVFIAKYNRNGQPFWASRAAIDTLNPAMNFMFAARFSKHGQHLGTDIFMEEPAYNAYGIYFDHEDQIVLTGSSFANTGLRLTPAGYATAANFDPVRNLKEENDRLLKLGYDQTIAGLFAAINLIKINNVVIPGKSVQEALDRYNPNFSKTAPNIYKSIASINFLKNNQGIILISTGDNKPVTIDYLKINNNASVKITEFNNGNSQLDVLSGISVGKSFVWYNLNFVRLLKDNGDLLFDYARDNTQKVFNLKKDILY